MGEYALSRQLLYPHLINFLDSRLPVTIILSYCRNRMDVSCLFYALVMIVIAHSLFADIFTLMYGHKHSPVVIMQTHNNSFQFGHVFFSLACEE